MPTGGWSEFWTGAAEFVQGVGLGISIAVILAIVIIAGFNAWGKRGRKS